MSNTTIIDHEIENVKIIKELFTHIVSDAQKLRDFCRQTGEELPETIEIKSIPYEREDLIPSYNKDVTKQFEVVTEYAVLERSSRDVEDTLLVRQLNHIRNEAGFIKFIF